MPPTSKWQGYAEKSTAVSTITIEDYFDCDGSKGINALLVDVSATWCGACQQAAAQFPTELKQSWAAAGIHILTLMVQDETQAPGTTKTALAWRQQFHLDGSAVVADPAFTFQPPGAMTVGLPIEIVVDPRTMKIVDSQEGFSGDYSTLTQLAAKNKTH